MIFEELDSVWMLEKMKKRRKMENFEIQSLRNVVKEGGVDVVTNIKKKFKEIKIEEKRKCHASTMYTEKSPTTHYTEAEHKQIKALYMGTESESEKRFQRNISFSQKREQSQDRRQRPFSQNRYDNPKGNYNQDSKSRYDRYRSTGRQDNQAQCDQS